MRSGALIDAHVHFYSAFDTQRFLDSAIAGFACQAESSVARVLCMAESAPDNWFEALGTPETLAETNWQCFPTDEQQSVRLVRQSDDADLLVIAGHQCVTQENIEVLMLGHYQKYPDGAPAQQVIEATLAGDAIPLLPWGFGKWLGSRGELVDSMLSQFGQNLLVGDNSGRLGGTPTPALLESASARGHCMLPGSDPLPMAGEEHKVASFGSFMEGKISNSTPFADLKRLLASETKPKPFGRGESLVRFLRNQLLMQKRKRWPAHA